MPPSSQTALQSLQAFKPREAKDVMSEAETKYDIAGKKDRLSSLRGLVSNLQSSVEAVDPSVTGRTTGTFTTEGQRSALVNRERQPILGSLAKEQQALGVEQQGFSESQSLATQMASALMNQDQTTYQKLLDTYNATLAAEQAAEQKRQYELNLAEQRRQFDEQQKASKAASAGGSYNLGSIASALKGNTPTAQKTLRQTWQEEANKGDYNAQVALNYAGDDGRYDGPVNSARELNILKSMGIKGNYFLRTTPTGGLSTSSTNGLSVIGSGALPTILNSKGLTTRL